MEASAGNPVQPQEMDNPGQQKTQPPAQQDELFRASWSPRAEPTLQLLGIQERPYGGYIFDLDGTLLDTMPLHYRAWNYALRRAGLNEDLDEALFYSMGGVAASQAAEAYGRHYGIKLNPSRVERDKDDHFDELRPQVLPIEPVAALARQLLSSRPLSVASGAPRKQVVASLRAAGLHSLFRVVVTAEDAARGKPHPDLFLLAASRMAVAPGACLVIEDADPGIAAARAAGMDWVRVMRQPTRFGGRSGR
jgi:HAD superfamily hydrolase (TIGR01509 family)